MSSGLRERWRVRARRTIQEKALDLFDERGFSAVTIEEIASAAEVSPSSVYRFFGTKEGLLVADEFDSMTQEALEQILDPDDPVGSLVQIVLKYETLSGSDPEQEPELSQGDPRDTPNAAGPWRRVRYFFQEPSVRTAACAALDRASQRIAPMMAVRDDLTATQARVAANALVFGYFAVLEQWYLDGGTDPIAGYVEEGMEPLRAIWAPQARRPGGSAAGRASQERPEGAEGERE